MAKLLRNNCLVPTGDMPTPAFSLNCLICDMSISGAALEISNPTDIPDRFNLFFKADGTQIPCHVIWRKDERIGVAFD